MPAEAYQGITGARGNEALEEAPELVDAVRLRRKLPFRLYMEVFRLRIRGMVVAVCVRGCDGFEKTTNVDNDDELGREGKG